MATETVKKNTLKEAKASSKKTADSSASKTAPAKKTPAKKAAVKAPAKKTTSLEVSVYDAKGKAGSKIALPENIFGLKWNGDLVHQVVTAIQANERITYAHTKDRSEVRGGGKKPWRQKGTGRARHGSSRSPIWAGGGVTFGPRKEKDYTKKANRKMKTKAVYTILSQKLRDEELIFVDSLTIKEPKTKEAKVIVEALAKVKGNEKLTQKKINTAMILLSERDVATAKSFRNIPGIFVEEARNMNPINLLTYKYVIIAGPKEAVEFLESKTATKK